MAAVRAGSFAGGRSVGFEFLPSRRSTVSPVRNPAEGDRSGSENAAPGGRSALTGGDGNDALCLAWRWNAGALSITIDLSEQKATLYRDGKVAGLTYVATGKSGFGTLTGSFRSTEKVRDKHFTL
jgi:hypothetical protein